ncbi:hypothetical protein N4T77_16990 [Clostridium sp. CX1]|uniref:hypothetical protein n=1 Tax=Clostridium sp. CX1 TaxID=2978346 RepID=UPI0021C05D42|nr:hypothetical protein [Clostridium sp. CX1]MCT8978286.1 hypothetical protein [Clostridium sp. CX1]
MSKLLEFLKESKDRRISAIAKLALETNRSLLEAVDYYNNAETRSVAPPSKS